MSHLAVLLKPARPDLVVRDPQTHQPLPADGDLKPLDTYWQRRLIDGDVIEVDTAAAD